MGAVEKHDLDRGQMPGRKKAEFRVQEDQERKGGRKGEYETKERDSVSLSSL